jgi:hypothetical protein
MGDQLSLLETSQTLEGAKGDLRSGLQEGINCPCCGRWAQAYWRGINKTMARALRWLYDEYLARYYGQDYACEVIWIDITKGPAWLLRSNQLATLRWWGLVERKGPSDDSKKHSGMWKPTRLAHGFLAGNASVPAKVCTVFGEVVDRSYETITVNDIRHHFNYADTMGGTRD